MTTQTTTSKTMAQANTSDVIAHEASEFCQTNVVNIRSARKAQMKAQEELLDYMMWTMKHDMDPHRLYDDPIETFRAELKATLSVA